MFYSLVDILNANTLFILFMFIAAFPRVVSHFMNGPFGYLVIILIAYNRMNFATGMLFQSEI